ncbi:calcium-binding protein [Sulfitobacter mediterraneus]|nr:hypothetical protein [Sulfitobacter mediterraneus]MCD2363646.1 hypothetical protein [Sulfitobacter mediterraneus]
MDIVTVLLGSLFFGLLLDSLPEADDDEESVETQPDEQAHDSDAIMWVEEPLQDGMAGSDQGVILGSGDAGNDYIETGPDAVADPEIPDNGSAIPPITDYVPEQDQILIEYDETDFPNPNVTVETVSDGTNTISEISLNGQEIGSVVNPEDAPALDASEIGLVPMQTDLTSSDDYYVGTPDNERIIGRQGDDTIFGGGGADSLAGWGGDDELIHHGSGGRLSGNQGDDYLDARKTSYGQYHLYGGEGDDTLVMHLDNESGWGHQGFHAYGGDQADDFRFVGAETTNAPLLSRIEDFDASEDSIWVDDVEIDLNALPDDMRIVDFHEQQWLIIGTNIMIGLEGARADAPDGVPTMMGSTEEMHFHRFPIDPSSLPTVDFHQS